MCDFLNANTSNCFVYWHTTHNPPHTTTNKETLDTRLVSLLLPRYKTGQAWRGWVIEIASTENQITG
jgi:hypothetical protein